MNHKFALYIAIVTTALVGCSGNDSTETVAPTEITAPASEASVPVRDLGGLVVTIASWAEVKEPEVKANAYDEALWEYRNEIMEKHNFKFEELALTKWNETLELFSTSTLAGEPAAEIFRFQSNYQASAINSGLAYDLTKVESINLDDPIWHEQVIEMSTVGDAVYGIAVEFEPKMGLYFNKRLFEEAGLDPDLLYDLQASGEWTWDKLWEISEKLTRDTDNDGVNDVYAQSLNLSRLFHIATLSNNGSYVGRDEDGKYFINLSSPETMEAFTWAADYIAQDFDLYPENWAGIDQLFLNAKVAMHIGDEWQAANFNREMEDDFGFVCFPKGPRATDYVVGMSDATWVIPNTFSPEEVEDIMFALELWNTPPPGYDGPDDWMTPFYPSYRDERAVEETLAIMFNPANAKIDYQNFIAGSVKTDGVASDVYWRSKTPAESVESMTPIWQVEIDKLNAAGNK